MQKTSIEQSVKFKLSKYVVSTEVEDFFLIYSSLTNKISKISRDLWLHLTNDVICELPENIKIHLSNLKILVENDIDEFAQVNKENSMNLAASTLYEVIQPSAFCQMGCFYCGQNHEKVNLNDINANKIANSIQSKIEKFNYKQLIIGWFGGEPLIAIEQMGSITTLLRDICLVHKIDYSAKIVTNGLLLTKSNIHRLINDLMIREIEITLDGLDDVHNLRRNLKASSNGTFKKIITNIKEIIKINDSNLVHITIRCNVDRTNAHSVIPLIDFLKQEGILNKVGFYTAKVYEWGDKTNKEYVKDFDYAGAEVKWLNHLLSVNYLPLLLPKRKHEVCLATKENSSVYDAYGNVFKCTEVPYTTDFKKSKYFLGKIDENKIENASSFRNSWIESIKNKESFCLDCNFYPVCGGACPKSWEDKNIPCPSFKFNMEDRIKMHYNLIQKNND
jgi:uncharacterized protein